MSTQRTISAAELAGVVGGSTRAHHSLVDAALDLLTLHRIPACPIATTGIPVQRADGSLGLKTNERQEGFSDVVICLPPTGRMGLLEMKTGGARRSPKQREMQARFAAAGAFVAEVRSIDDVIEIIHEVSNDRRSRCSS
jgi:hypothetical protein